MRSVKKVPPDDPLSLPEQRAIIDRILTDSKNLPGATMVVLNELQSQIGYISKPMQEYVARQLNVPVSTVHGVVSFYSFFTTTPRGRHTVKFCMGTACYVGGTQQLLEKSKQILTIEPGETTKNGAISVELCRCVGACSQAPVVVVDEKINGRMRPNRLPRVLQDLIKRDQEAQA